MMAARIRLNPAPEELRELTLAMPNSRVTEFGNLNVRTRVTSRSPGSTFIVAEGPGATSGKVMRREEFEEIARVQDDYLRSADVVVLEGCIGNHPQVKVRVRLVVEAANANIAAMQQHLYYPPEPGDPELQVIYTPNLTASGYPEERVIAVDLEAGITRILGTDYFGESKKGGLRMWNRIVYERGGLALHAACKVIPTARGERVFLIMGLSGTGKTTTTFVQQNGSLPVQDDFVALMPGGTVHASEAGCFAKTFGLDPVSQPLIYRAVTSPRAYLENVFQDQTGRVDLHETSYTSNGRATFPLEALGEYRDARSVGPADALLILNWNENIVPAVAKLDGPQAAAYFMLGETTGTSAGGKAEEGRALRIPGTNPFFPLPHGLQGNRFLELLDSHPLEVYLLNTGWVGGPATDERSKKVSIADSSAIVKALAEGRIRWTEDPDFGYLVAEEVPGVEDRELLQPRYLYERQGRSLEYRETVERLKAERRRHLELFPELAGEVRRAVA